MLEHQSQSPYGYTPGVLDGKVLKQSIGTAIASGQFNRVPVLNGTNHDESRLFVGLDEWLSAGASLVTAANYQARIREMLGVSADVAAVVATEYPLDGYPSPSVALSAANTDAVFACPALKLDEWASKYVPTFAYEFNDENAPQRFLPAVSFPDGAAHQSETQYLFDLPTAWNPGTLDAGQQRLATSMQRYWASFAEHGRPVLGG